MKFNIRCDLEGLTGITRFDQVMFDSKYYQQGKNALIHDLLAVIDGIATIEPEAEIIIYDEHDRGCNVDPLQLPKNVSYIAGKPPYSETDAGFLEGCAGLFLVGFHSKAGTVGALMPHTYEDDIEELKINDLSLGEVGVEAAIAAEYNVPALFYSGDSSGAAEFQILVPNGVAVTVKESLSKHAALCYSGRATSELLSAGAAEAVRRGKEIAPFDNLRLQSPFELKIKLRNGRYKKMLQEINPEIFDNDEWVTIKGNSVKTVFAQYIDYKLKVSALMI